MTGYPQLRPFLEAAIRAAAAGVPAAQQSLLSGATVRLIGRGATAAPYRFHVLAGRGGPWNPHTRLTVGGAAAGALELDVAANVQQYTLSGGSDGTVPVDADALIGVRGSKSGLYALEDVDRFNILCIPQASSLGASEMRAVYTCAEAYCEQRRPFLLVDIPAGVEGPDAMQAWLSQNESLRHRNAAVYFPRLCVLDPLNESRLVSVGASGTVAGLYAATDAAHGVWRAPAGMDIPLRNVQELACVLTDA